MLADDSVKLKRPAKQMQMQSFTIQAEDEKVKKDVKGLIEDSSSRCNMCNG